MKLSGNFTASIWRDEIERRHKERLRYLLSTHGVGFLHQRPKPPLTPLGRWWRFRALVRAWWWLARAPLRRLGGCHEDER